jgi:maltose alpha-D-glucosyltransferase / alpha-amylase
MGRTLVSLYKLDLCKNVYRTLGKTSLIPDNREDLKTMLDTFILEKAVYELNYELNNRPDWVMII